uniref:Uncharacterized protein n=1 Tax=Desulfovibrio sp. U5L TaxID=596152 RepID=I2Q025_9BACT
MAALKPIRFGPCLGLNTVSAPEALTYDGQTKAWEAADLVNLDVLDGGRRIKTRPGFSLALAGDWRDGFTAPDGRAYAVKDDALVEVLADMSTRSLVALAAPGRVSWAALDDLVFWSNGAESGMVRDGEAVAWGGYDYPENSEAGRYVAPPAGTILAGFAGRVWIGEGRLLHYTDGDDGQFYQDAADYLEMPAEITILAPVDDGLYVGTTAGVWFLAGSDPTQGMQMVPVSSDPATPCTSLPIRSDEVTQKYNPAGAAIWTSRYGIVIGLTGGIVLQPTKDRVALDAPAQFGAACLVGRRYVVVLHP